MISSKRKPLTFFPVVMDDYRADTLHLTTLQHGAYFLIMLRYFEIQQPLPEVEVCRASLLDPTQWEAERSVLAAFFIIEDQLWRHKRIERDLHKMRMTSKARARNGAKGGKESGKSRANKKQIEANASSLLKQNTKQIEAELDGSNEFSGKTVPIARQRLSKVENELLAARGLVWQLEEDCKRAESEIAAVTKNGGAS